MLEVGGERHRAVAPPVLPLARGEALRRRALGVALEGAVTIVVAERGPRRRVGVRGLVRAEVAAHLLENDDQLIVIS